MPQIVLPQHGFQRTEYLAVVESQASELGDAPQFGREEVSLTFERPALGFRYSDDKVVNDSEFLARSPAQDAAAPLDELLSTSTLRS